MPGIFDFATPKATTGSFIGNVNFLSIPDTFAEAAQEYKFKGSRTMTDLS
jgi:hypothetical protein